MEVIYDNQGRMNYHPFYHPNHGKPFTFEELEYLCKFYETDGKESIGMALGRTPATIANKVWQLKKQGKYDYYRNLNRYW